MKRLFLLLITMCVATAVFAQTPAPAPKLETWKINDQFSVQYDPTVWKLVAQAENNDKTPQLYPLVKDEKGDMVPRLDASIRARVLTTPDHTYEETVKHAVSGIRARQDMVVMDLSEFFADDTSNRAVFFAYMQSFKDDARMYLINDYAFPGTAGDTQSHTTVLFEAMFPVTDPEDASLLLKQSDTVIKTFKIEAPTPKQ